MILFEKYGQHQPLNRQAERYAREGVGLSLSTLTDQVGGCAMVLHPLYELIRTHVFAGDRVHGDDTPVPVLAKGKTVTGRLWTYVRDDRPFGGHDPPAAIFFYSRDRGGDHPEDHLTGYAGILQADAYAGFNRLYAGDRSPRPISEAACWAHARRKFFVLADVSAKARGKLPVVAPLALEAVKKIDAIFDIEREINGRSAEERLIVRRSLRALRNGCVPSGQDSPVMPKPPRQWTTCSSAGFPSPASSMTDGFASPTTPPSASCAASRLAAKHGCSPVQTAGASGPQSCTR
jgi:transposase